MEEIHGRFDLIISKKNDVYLTVETDKGIARELSDFFTFEVPGAKFMPQYQKPYVGWKDTSVLSTNW